MPQETDQQLEEELKKEDYKQSTSDPNRYWKSDDNGGYREVDTDGPYVSEKDSGIWTKR